MMSDVRFGRCLPAHGIFDRRTWNLLVVSSFVFGAMLFGGQAQAQCSPSEWAAVMQVRGFFLQCYQRYGGESIQSNMACVQEARAANIYAPLQSVSNSCQQCAASGSSSCVSDQTQGSSPRPECAFAWQQYRACQAQANQALKNCTVRPGNMGPCQNLGPTCSPPSC